MRYLALFMLTACGIGSTMDGIKGEIASMRGSVSGLNSSLAATGSAIKSQGVAMALAECQKPENLRFINLSGVVPASIIPCAKAFGELATDEQIIGLTYLWLIDLNQGTVDAATEAQRIEADIFKLRKLMILEAIAGMLPRQRIISIYNTGGNYENAVFALLAFRYQFIADFLLEAGFFAITNPSPAQKFEARKSIAELRFLEFMPQKSRASITLLGFFSGDLNQTIKVEARAKGFEDRIKGK